MIPEKIPSQELSEDDKRNLHGFQNKCIRLYYYLERGLEILNEFRNLFLGIVALYIALKLTNILWAAVMVLVAVCILMIVGRYNVHKLSKIKEWLNMRFSTHYGIRTYDYNVKQTELLEEIRDLLHNKANGTKRRKTK